MQVSRRSFLGGLATAGAAAVMPFSSQANVKRDHSEEAEAGRVSESCPFRLSVINDEISQDFDHACSVAANDFGLRWIELRGMWNKNIADLDEQQIAEARRILKKYDLRVTDIASPLFKVDWPGAPRRDGLNRDQFNAHDTFAQQDMLLERCLSLTKKFGTDRIRCFDFWRLADVKPYRDAMNEKLQQAAARCEEDGVILLLENEMDCNTGTGKEAAATLAAIPNKNFMLNWDPGNAGTFPGAVPYPNGFDLLPKERIGHCHAKNVKREDGGQPAPMGMRPMPVKSEWEPVGIGVVDWVGQLKALHAMGYHYAVSLETHWRGAGTPEASSRVSMADLKKCLAEAGVEC